MKIALALVVLGLTVCPPALSAECNGQSTPGPPNLNPIDTSAPVLVRTVPNGKHFKLGSGEDSVDLLHLYGTPYDWGKAHGQLMKSELMQFFPQIQHYLETQLFKKAANSTALAWIAKMGIDAALDLSYEVTKRWTPSYVMDEIRGLADGSGVDEAQVRRLMWVGELTRGACSMFGAWGDATASRGGDLLQLRALDWDVDGPFKNYPAVVVYHPSEEEDGHAFANLGFLGWSASITGMSSRGLAVSEIGVSYPDSSFGKSSYLTPGYPFGFLIRDILQFDTTLDDATNRITNAKRTANLLLGVGEGSTNRFTGFQYSPSVANVMDDRNLQPVNESWHPRIENIVYWGMDWICPNDNRMLSHQLRALYGNITVENTIAHIVPYVQTGDLHIAIYDFAANTMYLSTAASDGESGPRLAYQRPFLRLNLTEAFNEASPSQY